MSSPPLTIKASICEIGHGCFTLMRRALPPASHTANRMLNHDGDHHFALPVTPTTGFREWSPVAGAKALPSS